MNRQEAQGLLQKAVNDPKADFHEGQWAAIDALVNKRRRLLMIQRTGWGKSSVYFIATRILRDRGAGPTLIVSPLLALMRNQIEAANRLGVTAETLNSTNSEEWNGVRERLHADQVDALLIAPERLSNEVFMEDVLLPIADRIGLFVVDEVHCISDWGHDFRPDYQRLLNVLRQMPPNLPILGTTATANNRVRDDIQHQLGNLEIQRGPLVRDSLSLQTIRLPDPAVRLAWLAQHIPGLSGAGIVYVLTIREAEGVADWLSQMGIDAYAYYSRVEHKDFGDSNSYRIHLEQQLLNNDLKVLVATTALGMGYDKPDLGFVIHYHASGSIIAYYQQVGRAGRAIDHAYGILLSGTEDEQIHEYFRKSAFPKEDDVLAVLNCLEKSDGLTIHGLLEALNLPKKKIDHVLKLLHAENPAPIIKQGSKWFRTPVDFEMDHELVEHLTRRREMEWQEIQDYIDTDNCLMAYLRESLDDPDTEKCGRCAVCRGEPILSEGVERKLKIAAQRFVRQAEFPVKPKVQVAPRAFQIYEFRGNLAHNLRASEGRILSRWCDGGWGTHVADDKHNGHFRDELVEAVAEMYEKRWQPKPLPEWVTCVPSLRHPELVPDFARRLAVLLNLPFLNVIRKVQDNSPQKNQQNRFQQCRNLDGAFSISDGILLTPVLLVDDVIDSGWTVTVLAALLRQSGSGPVFPTALASTSTID